MSTPPPQKYAYTPLPIFNLLEITLLSTEIFLFINSPPNRPETARIMADPHSLLEQS